MQSPRRNRVGTPELRDGGRDQRRHALDAQREAVDARVDFDAELAALVADAKLAMGGSARVRAELEQQRLEPYAVELDRRRRGVEPALNLGVEVSELVLTAPQRS